MGHRLSLSNLDRENLAFCAERGEEPEKPYSGTFIVRIPLELHRDAVLRARLAGQSLNRWVTDLLGQAAADPPAPTRRVAIVSPSTNGRARSSCIRAR